LTARTGLLSSTRSRVVAALGVVVFLVLAGAGAANATWTALAGTASASASATSATVTMSDLSALNTTYNYTGSTSPIVIAPVTIKNTGGAPLSYVLTSSNTNPTLAAKIKAWIWLQAGSTCGTTTVGTAGTLAALPALPAGATSAGQGVQFVVCVATQLTGTVAASTGQSVQANLTISGTVGTSWQATAGSSTTQSVFQAADVTGIGCVTTSSLLNSTATVSWTRVPAATGYTVYNGTTVVATLASTVSSITLTSGGTNPVSTATSVRIVANYAGGVSSAGVTVALEPQYFIIFLIGTACG
jgi:cellulose 1,4-beta-cellobiosidase